MLLLSVAMLLKRNVSIKRVLLGAFVGGMSIFLLFIRINNLELFFLKFLISLIMTMVTFSYKNVKYTIKNLEYLYVISIFLGGALYALNDMFSYKQEGLVFFHNGLGINALLCLILGPIILVIYLKQMKKLKNKYSNYYPVDIYFKGQMIHITGFLDTGNTLRDPISNKPVMIVNENLIEGSCEYRYIPYETISGPSMLKCIKVDEVNIEGYGRKKNVLLGLVNHISMDGIDVILNQNILEGNND